MKYNLLLILALLYCGVLSAQKNSDDPVSYDNALLISPHFSFQIPLADMGKRFGVGYEFGMGLDYKFGKNFYAGGEGGFIFGTNVKDKDHLTQVISSSGLVITDDGYLDDIHLNLRGAMIKGSFGKSFYFKPSKPNNGVLVKFQIGYLQHKILIDVDKQRTPQLVGDYAKGYDRFSNGLLLGQYIGLIRLERGKFVNLSFGLELTEAFTKNRRPYDFYLEKPLDGMRFDMMAGLKLIWMIPVFKGTSGASSKQYYTY